MLYWIHVSDHQLKAPSVKSEVAVARLCWKAQMLGKQFLEKINKSKQASIAWRKKCKVILKLKGLFVCFVLVCLYSSLGNRWWVTDKGHRVSGCLQIWALTWCHAWGNALVGCVCLCVLMVCVYGIPPPCTFCLNVLYTPCSPLSPDVSTSWVNKHIQLCQRIYL